uniref:Uncharacterized protein n=1 Tax=Meloidogyne enterolobii TaxID=390850 RepID=A0A6V7V7K2_MELEN|nr:unnamed protein product [Meloidogyne enterolobii]
MKTENNGHIHIGKLLEIKKKIRSVLGDLFFAKFELKESFLFRLDIVEESEQIRLFVRLFSNIPDYSKLSKEYFILFNSAAFDTLSKHGKKSSEKIWNKQFLKYFDKYFNSQDMYLHQQFLKEIIGGKAGEEVEKVEKIKIKEKLLKIWRDNPSEVEPLKQLFEAHVGARSSLLELFRSKLTDGRNILNESDYLYELVQIGI